MLSCEQATRLLSESQERSLTLSEKMNLKVHTAMCSGCRNFGRQLTSLRELIRQDKEDSAQAEKTSEK
ncbi:zf-HC2 domain-containing protein [Thalassolituus sp.]|uniref:zf-HC2 domain-containing protein n=1 Tax=Thalassolituus sp. TaxID=2030822 RepID=UPI00351920E9